MHLREGLLIAIEVLRGLRLRSVLSLKLGTSIHRDNETDRRHLEIPPEHVENGRYIATQLTAILSSWLDRYTRVELPRWELEPNRL